MPADRLRIEIAQHVATRLSEMRGREVFREDHPGYVLTLEDNLGPGVAREDFAKDFAGAEEAELVSSGGVDRLCAVHSTDTLVVNTFGPFRRHPRSLRLAGRSRFSAARFRKKLRTGLGGPPPSLGFYAYGEDGIVTVEAAFTETVSRKTATFSSSYARVVGELAAARWGEVYDVLCTDPAHYRHLDAALLVKHYLGIKYGLSDEPQPKALVYVFWEPANWPEVPEFALHRQEALAFAMSVAGGDVEFSAVSFGELWDEWERQGAWAGNEGQLGYLRERYGFSLPV